MLRGRNVGEHGDPKRDLGLLHLTGRGELLVLAHHRVDGHVAEVTGEHRIAAAFFDLLHLGLSVGGRRALEPRELEVDELDGGFVQRLGWAHPDRGILGQVILEEAERG